MDSSKPIARRALSTFAEESRLLQIWQSLQHPTRSLIRRAASTATSSSTTQTCIASESSNTCEKPAQYTAALPIALGVTVPIVAMIVFFFLHRRYRQRLRAEDRRDAEKYKSMDFGMDLDAAWSKGNKKGGPEMTKTYPNRQMKGLSLDPSHSPFFLNDDKHANQSTDSFYEEEDRYKLVKIMDSRSNSRAGTPVQFSRSGTPTQFSRSKRVGTESTFTANTQFGNGSESRLVSNAQAPAMSPPPRTDSAPIRGDSMSPTSGEKVPKFTSKLDNYDKPLPPTKPEPAVVKETGLTVPTTSLDRDSYFEKNAAAIRKSNNYLNDFFQEKPNNDSDTKRESDSNVMSSSSTVVDTRSNSMKTSDSTINDAASEKLPPVPSKDDDKLKETFNSPYRGRRDFGNAPVQPSVGKQISEHGDEARQQSLPKHKSFEASMHYTPSFVSDRSNLTDILKTPRDSDYSLPPVPALPHQIPARGESLTAAKPVMEELEEEEDYGDALDNYLATPQPVDGQRLSVLMRPLPPDDPQENPEERAMRIRSFYKEYFDDSKQYTSSMPLPPLQSQHAAKDYYEDYSSEYLNQGTIYDAEQNGFVVANAPYAEPVTRRAMTPPPRAPPRFRPQEPPRGRSRAASNSMMRGPPMSPRNASAMSNRIPPRGQSAMSHMRRHDQYQRNMPPPKSLKSLPTPHLLKDDAAIFGAADFAPPISFRERQNGRRPDSPLGVQRPFSPSVRPFVPLNSSFDDLSHVPSPHMLRKSGTFNNLDFAPPARFKNADTGSDVSSLRSGRSGRSGISAGQHHAMRAGAYRISRAPKELIGTKTDIMGGLRPQWDLTRPA